MKPKWPIDNMSKSLLIVSVTMQIVPLRYNQKSKCWKNCKFLRNISIFDLVKTEFEFRPELKPVEKEVEVKLKFPDVEPLNPPVLAISDIEFRYNPKDTLPVFKNVNLSATSDSRICIVCMRF